MPQQSPWLRPRQLNSALAAAFYDPAFLATVPLIVAPGTFYNYSNPNFALAGLLAEAADGNPYRDVMRQRVFKPLGMKRTTFLPSEVLSDNDFAYGVSGSTVVAPDEALGTRSSICARASRSCLGGAMMKMIEMR